MGKINDTVRTVNSSVRTLLLAVLMVAAGFAGWKGYSLYNEPQKKLAEKQQKVDQLAKQLAGAETQIAEQQTRIGELETDIAEKAARIDKLETSNRLLKLRHRIARLRTVDQTENEQTGRVETTIEFYEVNAEGAPIGAEPRTFTVEGDRVYVECLVAKFDDRYVEEQDLDRGTAICLFQRIFGEYQQPTEGYELDESGTTPTSYARGGEMSPFEQRIWRDFWEIANDRKKAAEIGIRAAHADAPSIRVQPGKVYELELRSTGEFTLRPLPSDAT
ncbi:MAG: hypothetical protein CMJ58_14425 [Planctomycetaceae bacterium]|nr:hypothetical protein [Planctomycetaceae bacterium]